VLPVLPVYSRFMGFWIILFSIQLNIAHKKPSTELKPRCEKDPEAKSMELESL
jgi:hypothetical protein